MSRNILLILALACLMGCAQLQAPRVVVRQGQNPAALMIQRNYQAAEVMAKGLQGKLPEGEGIMVTTFNNTADRAEVTVLGKLIPEQISSRMAQLGLRPVSPRHSKTDEEGGQMTAGALLVGDYTVARDVIFVNVRVVDILNAKVLAGFDYSLPASGSVLAMLPGRNAGPTGMSPSVITSLSPRTLAQE